MVTISITAAAFAVFGATLPEGFKAQGRPDGKGCYLVTLDRYVVERLAGMRGRTRTVPMLLHGRTRCFNEAHSMTERTLEDFFDALRLNQRANRESFPDWYAIIVRVGAFLAGIAR